jgi:septum site-determining protein MinD
MAQLLSPSKSVQVSAYNTVILSFIAIAATVIILRNEMSHKPLYLFLVYFIISIVNRVNVKYPIGAALILLPLAAVMSAQGKEALADNLAIYAYYFLLVGVMLKLLELFRGAEKTGEPEKSIALQERGTENLIVKSRKPRFIAIASGKGGVGKTTIAANLGVALSKLGMRVVIIDMDISMPNLEIVMGLKQPPVGLIDAIEGKLNLKQVTYVGCDGVSIIPPGLILEGFTERNIKKIKTILGEIKDWDYIIFDMPPGREAVRVLRRGYEMLLVVNPEIASVLDAVNLKAIALDLGITPLGVVMNREGGYPDELSQREIEEALELSVLARITEDRRVVESYAAELPFLLKYPRIGPSKELLRLATWLTEHDSISINFTKGKRLSTNKLIS